MVEEGKVQIVTTRGDEIYKECKGELVENKLFKETSNIHLCLTKPERNKILTKYLVLSEIVCDSKIDSK